MGIVNEIEVMKTLENHVPAEEVKISNCGQFAENASDLEYGLHENDETEDVYPFHPEVCYC